MSRQKTMENKMKHIFYKVQFDKTCHKNYMKKLYEYYEQCDLNEFVECFVKILKVPLTMGQRHPRIENIFIFVSNFVAKFYTVEPDENDETMEPTCPFFINLFEFLLAHHNAVDPSVRFRICHFLNMLLSSMGNNASIDDSLCDKITTSMTERLLDKSPRVRAQAVFTLHRLQDPTDDNCPVIKLFLFHLTKDPNAEVRKAVLLSMGKNQKTFMAALGRTRDVNDTVRKMAYQFISKITVRSLTIKQRGKILSDGLKDRSEMVNKYVQNTLLPGWLRFYNGDYISFVRGLDAEIGMDTCILALNTLFKNADFKSLLEHLPLDNSTKCIPLNNLSSENVLFWRCLAEYFQKESCIEEMEIILPELSKLCEHINDFLTFMSSRQFEASEQVSQKFILLQLFEMTKIHDLSDEVGRNNLKDLILHTLMLELTSEKIIDCTVKYLEKVIPDVNTRVSLLANVISELRLPSKQTVINQISPEEEHERAMQEARLKLQTLELEEEEYQAMHERDYSRANSLKLKINKLKEEINKLRLASNVIIANELDDICEEKNDPQTLTKCLSIIYAIMKMKSVTTLTPTLRDLTQIAVASYDNAEVTVHMLALKVIALRCILDKEQAKLFIPVFFLQLEAEAECPQVRAEALKAIFDILLYYGLEQFNITQSSNETLQDKANKSRKLYSNDEEESPVEWPDRQTELEDRNYYFFKCITASLDNLNQEIRTIAAEGLCKLLLTRKLSSPGVLSRLIIMCFNPINDSDFYLRQCLYSFFNYFVVQVPESSNMLEEAFLSTLRVLYNAPDISPLQQVDPYEIASFILLLTRPNFLKSNNSDYSTHNNLAFAILAELLDPDSEIDQKTLVKCFKDLYIQIEDETSKTNLLDAIKKASNMISDPNKRLMTYIRQLEQKLKNPGINQEILEEVESENELS